MSNADAMKQLRGPKHENWLVCGPRAAPPAAHGLGSGKNWHLARATRKWQMGRSMAHIAHQPGPVSGVFVFVYGSWKAVV
jgi:hypothetical protein